MHGVPAIASDTPHEQPCTPTPHSPAATRSYTRSAFICPQQVCDSTAAQCKWTVSCVARCSARCCPRCAAPPSPACLFLMIRLQDSGCAVPLSSLHTPIKARTSVPPPPSPPRHTSLATRHTSHATRHTSHATRHTSHATRHTSHVTRHTSHVTRLTSPERREVEAGKAK